MSNSTYCEDHYEQPDWMKKIQGLEKQNKELRELLEKNEKEYIDKEKIRKEVKRLRKRAEHNFDISLTENERQFWLGEFNVLTLIGKYIESLQEEPASEDLEEAAVEWFNSVKYKSDLSGTPINAFKAGAEWKEEEMMAKAINTEASLTMSVPSICISLPLGVNVGDKVKVIVIKEK